MLVSRGCFFAASIGDDPNTSFIKHGDFPLSCFPCHASFRGSKRLIGKTQIFWVHGTKNSFFPAIFLPGTALLQRNVFTWWNNTIDLISGFNPSENVRNILINLIRLKTFRFFRISTPENSHSPPKMMVCSDNPFLWKWSLFRGSPSFIFRETWPTQSDVRTRCETEKFSDDLHEPQKVFFGT